MTTYTASMNQLLDTHQAVKDLVNSGFVEGQAEAIVSFQVRFLSENVSTKRDVALIQGDIKAQRLATQHDIEMIHKDIAIIHKDIASLRAETKKDIEMLRAETKKDIEMLRAETQQGFIGVQKDIESLKAETKKDIEMLRAETQQGFIGVQKELQTQSAKLIFRMGAIATGMGAAIVTLLLSLLIFVV